MQINAELLKRDWVDLMIKKSKEYLNNPSEENSKFLKEAFNSEKSLRVPPYDISQFESLSMIPVGETRNLIGVALKAVGSAKAAEAVLNPHLLMGNRNQIPVHNLDKYLVFQALNSYAIRSNNTIEILLHFPWPDSKVRIDFLNSALIPYLDSPDNHDATLAMLKEQLSAAHSPREVLLDCLKNFPDGWDWRDLVRNFLRQLTGNQIELKRILNGVIPDATLEIAIHEILSRDGNYQSTEVLANSPLMTTRENYSLIPVDSGKRFALARKLILHDLIEPLYVRQYVEAEGVARHKDEVAHIAHYIDEDIELREKLSNLVFKFNLDHEFIERVEKIKLTSLTEAEKSNYYLVLKKRVIPGKIVEFYKTFPVDDPEFLAFALSDYFTSNFKEAIQIYIDLIKNADLETRDKLESLFTRRASNAELLKIAKSVNLNTKTSFLRLGSYLIEKKKNEVAEKFLLGAAKQGSPQAAVLLLEHFTSHAENLDFLELASNTSSDYKRKYAIELLKRGAKDVPTKLLESIAYTDTLAAQILIHVLGKDIFKWAQHLADNEIDFSEHSFSHEYSSLGLKTLPKTELESEQLHGILLQKTAGVSRKKIESGDFVVEKWHCNRAITAFTTGSWRENCCEMHRDSVLDFERSGLIREFTHINIETLRSQLNENSLPFGANPGSLLSKNLSKQTPRRWQLDALKAWAEHGRQGIIEAVTGSGKSRVAVMAAMEAIDDGFAVLIVVPNRILQQQWIRDYFAAYWGSREIPIRTMGNEDSGLAPYVNPTRSIKAGTITVAVVNTLSAIETDPRFYSDTKVLLIVDEVHNFTGNRNRKVMRPEYERRLGLTATLEVSDGRYGVLANYFGGHPIFTYDFSQAVKDKVISAYDLLLIRVPLGEAELRNYKLAYQEMITWKEQLLLKEYPDNLRGNFESLLRYFKSSSKHLDLIKKYEEAFEESDKYLRESESKANALRVVGKLVSNRGFALVFCDLNATCMNVQAILEGQGARTMILNQAVDQLERERAFTKFERGNLNALIAPKVLDEGVDIKLASLGVFAGTSRRRLQTIQRLGRVLRIHEDKAKPLIVLPVSVGTEEDPRLPENHNLQLSVYAEVFSQKERYGCFNVTDQSNIDVFINETLTSAST